MSEFSAKAIRASSKAKAHRLGGGEPHKKVDASSWTPPEDINAGAQTGLRPVSKRAYKRGGHVAGHAVHHAGKKPRSGSMMVAQKINRNVKDANAEFGKPHIGGLKHGGRAHHAEGGAEATPTRRSILKALAGAGTKASEIGKGMAESAGYGAITKLMEPRPARADGGQMDPRMQAAARAGVPPNRMSFGPRAATPLPNSQPAMKRGGAAHPDVAEDKRLVHTMVKPSALKPGKAKGGSTYGAEPRMRLVKTHTDGDRTAKVYKNPEYGEHVVRFYKEGKHLTNADSFHSDAEDAHDTAQAELKRGFAKGGGVYEADGTRPTGGRMARAHGGETPFHEGNTEGYTKAQLKRMNEEHAREMRGISPDDDMYEQHKKTVTDNIANRDFGQVKPMQPPWTAWRKPRAHGGATKGKGKTNINIIIGAHGQQPGQPPMGMPPMPPKPPAMPVPVPPPPPGGAGAGMGASPPPPMPMPYPVPMGGTSMPPGGGGMPMPPMGRKRGGKVYPIDSGAGGGEARLEKIKAYGTPPLPGNSSGR